MSDHFIHINKLYQQSQWGQWDGHFKYSKFAEHVACELLARKKGWIVESVVCENNEYDAIVSGKKIEVKFSGFNDLHIEYCTASRKPSGIMTTKADYYLMINAGWARASGDNWDRVGKVRLIPVPKLQAMVIDALEGTGEIVRFDGTPGSHCIKIDPKSMNGTPTGDGYICDIGARHDEHDGWIFHFAGIKDFSNRYTDRLAVEVVA